MNTAVMENSAIAIQCSERTLKTALQYLLFKKDVDQVLAETILVAVTRDGLMLARTDRVRMAVVTVPAGTHSAMALLKSTAEDIRILNKNLGALKRSAVWRFLIRQPIPVWEQHPESGEPVRVPLVHAPDLDWMLEIHERYFREAGLTLTLRDELAAAHNHTRKDPDAVFDIDPETGLIRLVGQDDQAVESWRISPSPHPKYRLRARWLEPIVSVGKNQEIRVMLPRNHGPVGFHVDSYTLWLMPLV